MRLIEINEVLKKAIPEMKINSVKIGGGSTKFANFKKAFEKIKEIYETGILQNETKGLLRIESMSLTISPEITMANDQAKAIMDQVNDLVQKSKIIIEILNGIYEKQDENSVAIRLPENQSLKETSKLLKDIDQILEQSLVNKYLNGKIELLNFDRGSKWLYIALGSEVALYFLSRMVELYYRKKELEIELKGKEIALKDLEINSDLRKQLTDSITMTLEKRKEDEFKRLINEHNIPENDHEYLKRLEHSLKMLSDMLDSGLQIHPALTSKEEIKEILSKKSNLIDKIKELPEETVD